MITLLLLLALAFGGFVVLLVLGIGIFEAPWPVLLGILIIGLLAIQWLSSQGRAIASSSLQPDGSASDSHASAESIQPATQSESEPHLVYRGIPYNDRNHNDVRPEEGDSVTPLGSEHASEPESIQGVYRGQHWHHENTVNSTQEGPLPDITYRGQKVTRRHK